jgi:hypothetical protein
METEKTRGNKEEEKKPKPNKGHHAVFEQLRACNISSFPQSGESQVVIPGVSRQPLKYAELPRHFKISLARLVPASKHGMELAVASELHCFQPECGISFRWLRVIVSRVLLLHELV